MLTKNLGRPDRLIRLVVGGLLTLGALMGYGLWMFIGLVLVATALINFCPIYRVLGINTCKL